MKRFLLISMSLSVIMTTLFVFNTSYFFQNVFAAETLYWGSTGDSVKQVQTKLINWGYIKGTADGHFGQLTYDGVVKFQKKHGLKPDGVVGTQTYNALGIPAGTTNKTGDAGAARNDEKTLLAKAITGEARGEPYVGQVAVGAVILNRTRSPSFPNTIPGVVYQPLAFTAVADGQINLPPDPSCLKAAEDALNGWDPSGGCLYYWNPAKATSKWIWSRQVVTIIGKHYFGL